MRKALTWLPALAVFLGTLCAGTAPAAANTAAEPAGPGTGSTANSARGADRSDRADRADRPDSGDIKDRILAIRGMRLVEEKPVDGYRFFVLEYTQPVDHRRPYLGTFQQRLTLLHKGTDRPVVFHTSGYHVSTQPGRSEPTRIVDGNQVSLEYRYFTPSRPDPADWSKLDIRQGADDQHRLFRALQRIYRANWLSTGGSKGGMTATYYRRFHPHDMDGTIAYVAPNDVRNREDSAYDRFFEQVSTPECRAALNAVQREALVRRDEIVGRYEDWARENGATFTTVGSADKAYENVVMDLVWAFWQYRTEADCAEVPAPTASTDTLYTFVDEVSGFSFYTDQVLAGYAPYFYQAGTELGWPSFRTPHLDGLLRHPGIYQPRSYVPRDIPMRWRGRVMDDIDRWVRHRGERMLFVYGENDPWGAERFRPGKGSRDAYVFTAPGANHGANIAGLTPEERDKATAEVLEWAGVAPAAVRRDASKAEPLAERDAKLDRKPVEPRNALRP
ncbi:S28 family serine protease [Streptomyces albus]|uniref:S28 family serine protease n=1 Tax=Streptomyces albus TaxID=1888 RepID=UPI0004C947C0|nr:S28 family serine protease [Streptomyces albus]